MKKKWLIGCVGCALLTIGLAAGPVLAQETEPDAVSEASLENSVETELEDGVLTIRIKKPAEEYLEEGFWWESWKGDKGDASFVEPITETDMEEGLAYAGSFRAIDNGEDTIRLVYTNGHYVKEYLDFMVRTEDDEIKEIIGGGQAYAMTGEDLLPYFEGLWEDTDGGSHMMEVSPADNGGLAFFISDGGGRDAETTFYTMTAFYDVISESLVYWDGAEHHATITDKPDETEPETEASGDGAGLFAIMIDADSADDSSVDEDSISFSILWRDDTFGNDDNYTFVRAE